jgi:hypothetical protein
LAWPKYSAAVVVVAAAAAVVDVAAAAFCISSTQDESKEGQASCKNCHATQNGQIAHLLNSSLKLCQGK